MKFICGVITIVGAVLLTSATAAFTPIPNTPLVGLLPITEVPQSYDIAAILENEGINPDTVTEILIYVYFTGLGSEPDITRRAYYELYTESPSGIQYKQFMNAVFDQPDTVIDSANLWVPYCNLAAPGFLYARMISANYYRLSHLFATAEQKSVKYKNLAEAMHAYHLGTKTIFREIFLIGYR